METMEEIEEQLLKRVGKKKPPVESIVENSRNAYYNIQNKKKNKKESNNLEPIVFVDSIKKKEKEKESSFVDINEIYNNTPSIPKENEELKKQKKIRTEMRKELEKVQKPEKIKKLQKSEKNEKKSRSSKPEEMVYEGYVRNDELYKFIEEKIIRAENIKSNKKNKIFINGRELIKDQKYTKLCEFIEY